MGKNRMKSLIFIILVCTVMLAFSGPARADSAGKDASPNKEVKQQTNPYANSEITVKIIPSVNNTFGYDILVYGRPLIHQPSIPGLPGNEGSKTEKDARLVAEFMVKKIKNNEMPPMYFFKHSLETR